MAGYSDAQAGMSRSASGGWIASLTSLAGRRSGSRSPSPASLTSPNLGPVAGSMPRVPSWGQLPAGALPAPGQPQMPQHLLAGTPANVRPCLAVPSVNLPSNTSARCRRRAGLRWTASRPEPRRLSSTASSIWAASCPPRSSSRRARTCPARSRPDTPQRSRTPMFRRPPPPPSPQAERRKMAWRLVRMKSARRRRMSWRSLANRRRSASSTPTRSSPTATSSPPSRTSAGAAPSPPPPSACSSGCRLRRVTSTRAARATRRRMWSAGC